MRIAANDIAPSQDFLKPATVHFILECLEHKREAELPPTPIVRQDQQGHYVAIDGHNLLAVRAFLGQEQVVHVATAPTDGLPEESEQTKQRSADLLEKFESCLVERDKVTRQGIKTFQNLIAQHKELFNRR